MYYKERCLNKVMLSLIFLFALALIPIIGVLAILVYIGYALYGRIACEIEGYKHHIGRGIISIWNTLYDIDCLSNELIFEQRCSFLPNRKDKCLKRYESKPKKIKKRKIKN